MHTLCTVYVQHQNNTFRMAFGHTHRGVMFNQAIKKTLASCQNQLRHYEQHYNAVSQSHAQRADALSVHTLFKLEGMCTAITIQVNPAPSAL